MAGVQALTKHRIEILGLKALGLKNYEVADKLFVTINTVKKTLEVINEKLNTRDKTCAVNTAWSHNMINNDVLFEIADKYHIDNNLKH